MLTPGLDLKNGGITSFFERGPLPWLVDVVFTESPHLPVGTGNSVRALLASCSDHRVGPQPPGTFEVGLRAACLHLDLMLCCCVAKGLEGDG